VDSAINQHPEITAAVLPELEQVTVTNALAVKPYCDLWTTRRNAGRWNCRCPARIVA